MRISRLLPAPSIVATRTREAGLSLCELLIAIAVIGILASVAVPTYQSFMQTAQMTKVSSTYQQAIQIAQITIQADEMRRAVGLPEKTPIDANGWADLLNPNGALAPGGGAAFQTGEPRTRRNGSTAMRNGVVVVEQGTDRGNPETGAIGIRFTPRAQALELWRPAYLSLKKQRAIITADGVDLREPNN